jgi:trehalose utilization protein
MKRKTEGSIIIPAGLDVWDHELKTAQVFARNGYIVQFLVTDQTYRMKTADVLIGNETYEIKSPKADKLSAVERNLKRAARQSGNIIIDSRRMSKVHDATIQKFLAQKLKQQKTIKKLLFVNRKHQIIDINTLI